MRIGVNAGSLERNCWSVTASRARGNGRKRARHTKILDDNDFHEYKISVKASDPFLAVAAYQAWRSDRRAAASGITRPAA